MDTPLEAMQTVGISIIQDPYIPLSVLRHKRVRKYRASLWPRKHGRRTHHTVTVDVPILGYWIDRFGMRTEECLLSYLG